MAAAAAAVAAICVAVAALWTSRWTLNGVEWRRWWVLVAVLLVVTVAVAVMSWLAARAIKAANVRVGAWSIDLFGETDVLDGRPCWCVRLRVEDVLYYMLWFERPDPVTGAPTFPATEADLAQLTDISAPRARKSRRFPMEAWSERRRLLMAAVGSVTVTVVPAKLFAGSARQRQLALRVEVECARLHLPRSSPAIDLEQVALYPDGYPNFVLPVYERLVALQWLLTPVTLWITQRTSVELRYTEIHGVADVCAEVVTSAPAGRESPGGAIASSVKAVGSFIRSTRQFVQDSPQPAPTPAADSADHLLTVFIDSILVSRTDVDTTGHLTVVQEIRGVTVLNGEVSCPVEVAMPLFSTIATLGSMSTELTLFPVAPLSPHAMEATVDIAGVVQPVSTTRSVWLAQEGSTKYALPCRSRLLLSMPCSVSSEFIASAVHFLKRSALSSLEPSVSTANNSSGGASDASHTDAWSLHSVLQPWVDLWWDDVGVGDLVSAVTGRLFTGVINGVNELRQPLESESTLLLRW